MNGQINLYTFPLDTTRQVSGINLEGQNYFVLKEKAGTKCIRALLLEQRVYDNIYKIERMDSILIDVDKKLLELDNLNEQQRLYHRSIIEKMNSLNRSFNTAIDEIERNYRREQYKENSMDFMKMLFTAALSSAITYIIIRENQ